MTRDHQQSVLILWAARVMVVLVVAAWVFSWTWVVGYGDWDVWCALGHGAFTLVYHRPYGDYGAVGFSSWLRSIGPDYQWAERNGMAYSPWGRMGLELPQIDLLHSLSVPLWLLLLFFAAAAWWLRPKPIAPNHCARCGYDLTGNLSGRCPECGTPTSAVHGDAKFGG